MRRSTLKRSRMKYNPPRENSVRELERTLDRLSRQLVLFDAKKCFTCDAKDGLDWGHLFERRHRATRWDYLPGGNNHPQCWPCNSTHEGHPEVYERAYVAAYGQTAYSNLAIRAHSNHKFTHTELLEMIAERETLFVSRGGQI
jgi:hypothetical protein